MITRFFPLTKYSIFTYFKYSYLTHVLFSLDLYTSMYFLFLRYIIYLRKSAPPGFKSPQNLSLRKHKTHTKKRDKLPQAFAISLSTLYLHNALHMGRVDGIDVCRPFFIASVRGNMSIGFLLIFEKSPFSGTYQYMWSFV